MRDVTTQTPILVFTPALSLHENLVEIALRDAGIPYSIIEAIGDDDHGRKCFLADTDKALDFVRGHRDITSYISFDAHRVATLHSKVPEDGEDEVVGTLEGEPAGLRYEDAKYRFILNVNDRSRTYVVR